MPRLKKPQVAKPEEVRIKREVDAAIIEHLDASIASTRLVLGARMDAMTDRDILAAYNNTVHARERALAEHVNVVVELPPGAAQVEYFKAGDQWVPKSGVLRCVIEDEGPGGEPTIWVDDREFTLREFGRMLTSHAGWGMRIYFVPEEKVHEEPRVEVRIPKR